MTDETTTATTETPETTTPAEGATPPPAEGATPPPEAPPEEEKKPGTKAEKVSKHVAELMRKTSQVRQQEVRLRQEREQLRPIAELRDLVARDPYEAWNRLAQASGRSPTDLYNDLTRRMLTGGQLGPEDRVRELETRVERQERERQEAEARQHAAHVEQQTRQAVSEIHEYLTQVGDDLPFLAEYDRGQVALAVFHEIQQNYNASGEVLDYETAARRLEDRMQDQHTRMSRAAAKKAAKVQPPPGANPEVVPGAAGPKGAQVSVSPGRTLANAHSQESGPPKPMTWQERRKRFAQST